MRRASSSSIASATYRKLQILPEALRYIRDILPDALALLKTSSLLCSQLEAAANDALQIAANSCEVIDISQEMSVESLYFAEAHLVRHVELNIGHRV